MFADRLKELRKEKGITQIDLAKAMELSKGTVAMWEVGKREVSFKTLSKLADYFEVSTDYLLGRSDDNSKETYVEEEIEKLLGTVRNYDKLLHEIKMIDDMGYDWIVKCVAREKDRCYEMDTLLNPITGSALRYEEE